MDCEIFLELTNVVTESAICLQLIDCSRRSSRLLPWRVLLVTSSRRPDHWIIPGGGVEPDEEPSVTAIREVREEAGVCGKLGRCLGVFENSERKHRTEVFVLVVTEELSDWEDARTMGRQRKWFSVEDALEQLSQHKPVQLTYLQSLLSCRNDKVT